MTFDAIVVMGVSGCGKSTVGESLAATLSARFLDADAFHPAANVEKMRQGIPLTDEDRSGWLSTLRAELDCASAAGERVVLACSALKQRYRDALGMNLPGRVLVFLEVTPATAEARLLARSAHFMPASLVTSQFEALEPPTHALTLDASAPLDIILSRIVEALASPTCP